MGFLLRSNCELPVIFCARACRSLQSRRVFRTAAPVSMKTKARSKRVRLIHNGKVAGNDALRAAVSRQRAAGHRIEVRVTWEKGDARRFVSSADKLDLLIAAGGDGTLNEVVHGLMDLSKPARPILG